MYTQDSIETAIAATDLVALINKETTLKKEGRQWKGKSPFTDEKTPSFFVDPAKQVWFCYSSQKGGGAIQFLEHLKGMAYIDAVKYLADFNNVVLVEEEETAEDRRHRSDRVEMERVLRAAYKRWDDRLQQDWASNGPISQYLAARGYTQTECSYWGIGYAPKQRDFITRPATDKGLLAFAVKAGLTAQKDERSYDVLQNRVSIQIRNAGGKAIGFSGRQAPGNDFGGKYVNTKETPLFNKSRVLYGWDKAGPHIAKQGVAMLVEGYTDVHALHRVGYNIAVAAMGTSFTEWHARQLAKACKTVVVISDGDSAGRKMLVRCMPWLLGQDLEVLYVALPEKEDPESLVRRSPDAMVQALMQYQDALLYFAQSEDAKAHTPAERGQAVEHVAAMLTAISSPRIRSQYIDAISREVKAFKKTDLQAASKEHQAVQEEAAKQRGDHSGWLHNAPKGIDKDFAEAYGYYPVVDKHHTGYYMRASDKHAERISNFVIQPLFHNKDPESDTRVITINNGRLTKQLEVPSKYMLNADQFAGRCVEEGNFIFEGNKKQLTRIMGPLLAKCPMAWPLTELGQQKEGFFAFHNAIFNGKLEYFNDNGLAAHADKHYYSPSAVVNLDGRGNEDDYAQKKLLVYCATDVTFNAWAAQLYRVFRENAAIAIGAVFVGLFYDLVYKTNKNAPLFYFQGPSQSGKTVCAASVSNFFFRGRKPFVTDQGTDPSFYTYLGLFANTVSVLNEFDDNTCPKPRFQAVKTAFDGEGRTRNIGKNNYEVQEIRSAILMCGQYLSTRDDNSILSRSIVAQFEKKPYTDEDRRELNKLERWETEGITGLTIELLKYRKSVEDQYESAQLDVMRDMADELAKQGKKYNQRVLRNYSTLVSLWRIFGVHFQLPWSYQDYYHMMLGQVSDMSSRISASDILTEFWDTLETLIDAGTIQYGIHFKVAEEDEIKLDGQPVPMQLGVWDEIRETGTVQHKYKILYLRLKSVMGEYKSAKRRQGDDGLNLATIVSYFNQRGYFMGTIKSTRFQQPPRWEGDKEVKSFPTSAHVFNYTMLERDLNVSLVRNEALVGIEEPSTAAGAAPEEPMPAYKGGQSGIEF